MDCGMRMNRDTHLTTATQEESRKKPEREAVAKADFTTLKWIEMNLSGFYTVCIPRILKVSEQMNFFLYLFSIAFPTFTHIQPENAFPGSKLIKDFSFKKYLPSYIIFLIQLWSALQGFLSSMSLRSFECLQWFKSGRPKMQDRLINLPNNNIPVLYFSTPFKVLQWVSTDWKRHKERRKLTKNVCQHS